MNYKTKGIVIKRMNYGEADRILTVLSERFGKVKVMAKGVRKIRSHMAGSLEPFILVDLHLQEGKNFYIVTGASINCDFEVIHSDMDRMAKAFYIGELIDRFLEEHQRSEKIFDLSIQALESIECLKNEIWLRCFEHKIVTAAGFKPQLFYCVNCKSKIMPGNNFWDSVEGGVICEECQRRFLRGKIISDQALKSLRFIECHEMEEIPNLKMPREIEVELECLMSDYINSILERDIKSRKFLKEVCR